MSPKRVLFSFGCREAIPGASSENGKGGEHMLSAFCWTWCGLEQETQAELGGTWCTLIVGSRLPGNTL